MLQYCFLVLAMPELVIAHAFSYFTERYAEEFLYQSAPLSVFADAIVFFPLAPIGGWASAAPAPVGLEEVRPPARQGVAVDALASYSAADLQRLDSGSLWF